MSNKQNNRIENRKGKLLKSFETQQERGMERSRWFLPLIDCIKLILSTGLYQVDTINVDCIKVDTIK